MSQPRVTVILSSYNHAKYVAQAIDSVLAQTFADWELIIVDDGSRDDSAQVISRHPAVRDPRVRVVLHKDNAGLSRRYNDAVTMARGEFVSPLPSDDWYSPNKLAVGVAAFESLPADYGVVYANGYRFYESTGETVPHRPSSPQTGWLLPGLFFDPGMIYPITPLVRRECLLRWKYFEDLRVEGEAIYWRIAISHRFHYVDEFVATMRAHDYNSGSNLGSQHKDVPAALERVFALPELPDAVRAERGRVLGWYLRKFAWNAIRQHGDAGVYWSSLKRALAADFPSVARDVRMPLGALLAMLPRPALALANRRLTSWLQRRGP